MSISFTRVPAPGEDWDSDRTDAEILPTLPVVLGRGSLLKCGEKKLSRRHAYLDWDDDGVMITSVHQSPTYVTVKGTKKTLTEGDSQLLGHGDKFGLLESNFWYRINLPNEERNSQEEGKADALVENGKVSPIAKDSDTDKKVGSKDSFDSSVKGVLENGSTSETASNSVDSKDHTSSSSLKEEDSVTNKDNDEEEGDSSRDIPLAVTSEELKKAVSSKQRALPTWLSKIDPSKNKANKAPSQESQKQCQHGGVRKVQVATTRKKSNAPKNASVDGESPNVTKAKQTTTKQKAANKRNAKISDSSDDDMGSSKQEKTSRAKLTPTKAGKKTTPSPKPSPKKKTTPAKKKGSPIKNNTKGLHVMSDEDSDGKIASEDDEPQTPKKTATPKRQSPKKRASPANHDLSDEEMDSEDDKPQTPKKTATPKPKRQSPKKRASPGNHDLSDEEEDEEEESTASPSANNVKKNSPGKKKKPRATCQFGSNCYRKNPKHLSDYAHMGDSDFHEESDGKDGSDDDRPQCEYGIDCYRKNKQHRKDYRHSRVPQPQRRAKRKARHQKGDGESGSDDYDYDDPFLNDESSDDYAPTESDSDSPMEADGDEEDDTRRMINEGKKFVKNRR